MASRPRRNTSTGQSGIVEPPSSSRRERLFRQPADLFAVSGRLSSRDRGVVAHAGVKVTRRDINNADNDYDKTQRADQFPVQAKCRVAYSVSLSDVSISFGRDSATRSNKYFHYFIIFNIRYLNDIKPQIEALLKLDLFEIIQGIRFYCLFESYNSTDNCRYSAFSLRESALNCTKKS